MDQSNSKSMCPTILRGKKITIVNKNATANVYKAKIPQVNKNTTENVQPQNETFLEDIETTSALSITTISTNICQHCAKFFSKKFNLHRHEKVCQNRQARHSEKPLKRVYKACICPKCHVQVVNHRNFSKHKRICKGPNEAKYKKCLVPSCSIYFYKRAELMKHLNKEHFQNIDMETLKFDSEEKFQEFKNEQNIRSSMSCVKHKGNQSGNECTYSYYGCNFNDKNYRNSKYKVPRYPCPARMMVKKYKNGVCEVKLINHHIHSVEEQNVKSFKYPREINKKIKVRLTNGVNPHEICRELFPVNLGNKNPMEDHSIAMEKIREIQVNLIRKKPKSQSDTLKEDCVVEKDEVELLSSIPEDFPSCQTSTNQNSIEEIEMLLDKLKIYIRHEAVQKKCLPRIHQILTQVVNEIDTVNAGIMLT